MAAMQQAPTISIVITTYNRPDALQAVVEACFGQDDKNFEIIIADDGSTANTKDCIDAPESTLAGAAACTSGSRTTASARRWRATAARWLRPASTSCSSTATASRSATSSSQHRKLARRGYLVSGSRVLLSPALTARVLAEHIDLHRAGRRATSWRTALKGHINKVAQLLVRWPDIGRAQPALLVAPDQELQPGGVAVGP